jgi:3-deoxy-D-manno-octulosonic-acid transferase
LFVFLYNIFLFLFRAGTHIASLFNLKAKKWVEGRKDIFKTLEAAISVNDKVIWMHCASLGEFEQGRPVLEKLKEQYPSYKILLTFFSPSGYEVQKNYKVADWVFYLPMDSASNARRFLEITHPALVIFVKYEFWYYYLKKIKYRQIPFILVSAIFRKDMRSFKWMGGLQLKMLSRFEHIFLQNETSKQMLDDLKADANYSVAGDTRFDRVIEIADKFQSLDLIENFCAGKKVLVAGSTWTEDEDVLSKVSETLKQHNLKLIIAPHEINEDHLTEIEKLFPGSIRYSQLTHHSPLATFLIIDNIGMLSKLYRYGHICFIGGGFKPMGVHNVTEAAVYGKPVLMGPYISKYAEAVELVNCGGGFVINNDSELTTKINELMNDQNNKFAQSSKAAYDFIRKNAGAAGKVLLYIQEKRLLTN